MSLQTRFPILSSVPTISATLALVLAGGGCQVVQLGPGDSGDASGEPDGSTTDEGPSGSSGEELPDPTGGPPAHCAESASLTVQILTDNCAKCHSGSAAMPAGSINYITDLDQLILEGKVRPGNAAESRVYARMLEESPMPPLSETQRPTEDDIATVGRWINECAGKSGCGDQPFMKTDDMLKLILSDVGNNVALEAQPFARYFSFVHLYNTGWCDDQIEIYRQALSKLVNSLSDQTKIRKPVPIDENRLIFRIDIRDYGWDKKDKEFENPVTGEISTVDRWDLLALSNPYTIEYIQDGADKIKADVGSRVFLQQGDAFLAVASVPPLYHEILDIPATRQELEARFGIDIEANIQLEIDQNPGDVARAGFRNSDVSFHHRMIERHEFPDASNRVYWISYDFAGNDGQKNFFAFPFDFEEDGGEIIFNLPNGLQAYMLVDAAGNRLDVAPSNVVKDKNQEDGIVVNGMSCMGCHNRGMIVVEDDLRYEIDNGGGVGTFDPDEQQAIFNIFPPRAEFTQLLSDDTNRFTYAAEAAGAPTDGDREQVLSVFLAFDEPVKLRRAAAELGLQEFELRELLSSLTGQDLDDLRKTNTSVLREVFTANYAQSVCDLKIGATLRCPENSSP